MQIASIPPLHNSDNAPNRLPNNLVCFSHLRWDFVFQRPQHLITRLAKTMNIFYLEEPIVACMGPARYTYASRGNQLTIITPHLPIGLTEAGSMEVQKQLFDDFMAERVSTDYGFWYYTPMALQFSCGYHPEITVFDCMDELSAFRFAPESIKILEKKLLKKADVVFTGGQSLYEAKKDQHKNIHAFPSSIDKLHFANARELKHNRIGKAIKLGFYGVIDERFDIELIREIAALRSEWEIELIGPVVKIDPATLPVNKNIHYPGAKTYAELPALMADWDLALIPFLLNESTRFISPTKTPEYLAAGLPVISTPIRDVINPYGKFGLVSIGHNAVDFVSCAEKELHRIDKIEWLQKVDFFLAQNSWDITYERMVKILNNSVKPTCAIYNTAAHNKTLVLNDTQQTF